MTKFLNTHGSVATVMANEEQDSLHFTPLGNIINLNRIWMSMEPQRKDFPYKKPPISILGIQRELSSLICNIKH